MDKAARCLVCHERMGPKFRIGLRMIDRAARIVDEDAVTSEIQQSKESNQTTYGSNPKTLELGPLLTHGDGSMLCAQIWLAVMEFRALRKMFTRVTYPLGRTGGLRWWIDISSSWKHEINFEIV